MNYCKGKRRKDGLIDVRTHGRIDGRATQKHNAENNDKLQQQISGRPITAKLRVQMLCTDCMTLVGKVT